MNNRYLKYLYLLSLIVFGSISISIQSIFIREFLVIFYGNELTIGVIYFIWFLGIMIGAWVSGSYFNKRRGKILIEKYAFLLGLMGLISIISIFVIRFSRIIFDIKAGEYVSFEKTLIIVFISVMPFSLMVGYIFPVAVNNWIYISGNKLLNLSLGSERAEKIGKVYLFESLGSVFAGALLAYLLYLNYANDTIAVWLAIFALLIANLLYLKVIIDKKKAREIKFFVILLFFLILMFSYAIGKYNDLANYSILSRWKSIAGETELIKSYDTKYQNLALGREGSIYVVYSNGKYLVSLPDEYTGATAAHIIMNQKHIIRKVLIIGLGAENIIAEILKYRIEKLDYVILEMEYIEFIKKHLHEDFRQLLENKKINVIAEDGRYYVNTTKEKYDLIIINQPDPSNANINRYYTKGFYDKAREVMTSDGVLIAFASSSINYFSEEGFEYTTSVYQTLKSVFPEVLITPGEKAIYIAAKKKGIATLDANILADRFNAKKIKSLYFTPYHFAYLLEPNRVKFISNIVQSSKEKIINTDTKPSTFFLNLIIWEKYAAPKLSLMLKSAKKLKFSFLIAVIIGYFILRLLIGLIIKNKHTLRRYDVLAGIFIIGFIGISMDLLILFMLQSFYGYIYQLISLFIALFMVGITVGSYIGNKIVLQVESLKKMIILVLMLHLVIALISYFSKYLPQIGSECGYQVVLGIIMIFSGAITGIFFPIANRIYIDHGGIEALSAGRTDSLDHLGAAFGSIFTGCFFFPLLGLSDTFNFIACLALMSASIFLLNYIITD